jgi:hypothetical protein
MHRRIFGALAIGLLAAACEADQEVFEEGADMDAAAEVEAAPAAPIGPQPMEPGAVVPIDTLQEIQIDTTG